MSFEERRQCPNCKRIVTKIIKVDTSLPKDSSDSSFINKDSALDKFLSLFKSGRKNSVFYVCNFCIDEVGR